MSSGVFKCTGKILVKKLQVASVTIIHVSSLYSRLGYSKGIIEGRWSTNDQSPATRSDTCRRSSVLKIDLCWRYFSPTYACTQRRRTRHTNTPVVSLIPSTSIYLSIRSRAGLVGKRAPNGQQLHKRSSSEILQLHRLFGSAIRCR